MIYSIAKLIERRQGEQYPLHKQYLNASLARVQAIIGFDKIYTRGEGSYLWDAEGNRYLDLLSGYSVFNLGRGHPVVKQAIQDILSLDRPNLVKMDCPLLAGLLAEELVKRMPAGLNAVFFANSGADAVDTALKFARAATKRPRMLYLDHAFHGLTLSTLALNGGDQFRKGFEPLMPGFDAVAMNDLEGLDTQLRRRDVAAGHLLAAERGQIGERYILGGENLTLRQILDLLAEVSGRPRVRLRIPHWVAQCWACVDVTLSGLRPHRTPAATPDKVRLSRRYEFFDPGKAVRELGLPQTPARVALSKAVEWYRAHGYAP